MSLVGAFFDGFLDVLYVGCLACGSAVILMVVWDLWRAASD